jgi:transcription factor IIIB subunit 2
MLIDFSDILQVNVFTLGATFLKLCRVLNLTLPHVDPSLYISRFAVALDFGDYTQRVAQDAVRIAQRMDRDWISSGRRPAGICGACLLIAARMNGFRRTTREMIYIVKVADVTIQKRLQEFNQTESAHLSMRDFRTIWLEKRADPPSFQKNRKIQEETESLSSRATTPNILEYDEDKENNEDDDLGVVGEKRKGKYCADSMGPPGKISANSTEDEDVNITDDEIVGPFGDHQKNITAADNGAKGPKPVRNKTPVVDEITASSTKKSKKDVVQDETAIEEQLINQQIQDALNNEVKEIANVEASLSAQASIIPPSLSKANEDLDATQIGTQVTLVDDTQVTLVTDEEAGYIPLKNQAYEQLTTEQKLELTAIAKKSVEQEEQELLNPNLTDDAKEIAQEMENWLEDDSVLKAAKNIEKEAQKSDNEADEEEEEDDGNLSDVDCDEIEAMILTPEEVNLKTRVWYNANKEFLEEMAVRRMVEKDKGFPYTRKNKHKKKKQAAANSPAEAAKQLLEKKKLSKKINQAVFDDMFESPESIAKIKMRDTLKKMAGTRAAPILGEYEVVEEPGDVNVTATSKKTDATNPGATEATTTTAMAPAEVDEEDEDEEDMDSDDMADDERFMRDARANYTHTETIDYDDYVDDEDF